MRKAFLLGCLAVSAGSQAQLQTQVYATGFSLPIAMVQDPTNPNVQFVIQQRGLIKTVVNGVVQPTDFMSLVGTVTGSGSEQGLLGMAFHPNYASNRFFYVNYTDTAGNTRVVRYTRNAANPLLADVGSAQQVLTIAQPFTNHNGGTIRFSPIDGYLYIGMGDGGSSNDPGNRAQTITNMLLGKMLRVDVDGDDFPADPAKNYRIPSTNPYVGVTGDDEIWAIGVRNPWKWAFDPPSLLGTGGMTMGDVGQGQREEVNYEPPGAGGRNYGWRVWEGTLNTGLGGGSGPFVAPIHEYTHSVGISITGGHIYRGLQLGDHFGRYFFADYGSSRVWSVKVTFGPTGEATASDLIEHTSDLMAGTAAISSIDTDSNGELYIVDYRNSGAGRILKVLPQERTWVTSLVPDLLTPIFGDIRTLSAADDKLLLTNQLENPAVARQFQSAFVLNLGSNAPAATLMDIFTDVASSASIGTGGTVDVFAQNWGTNSFDLLGSFPITPTMSTKQILSVPIANYRRVSDGAIQLRHLAKNNGVFMSDRYTIRYDRVKVVPR